MTTDRDAIKEIFLDFQYLERTTGEQIAKGILHSLERSGLDIMKCRGQACDGAACMSSGVSGVHGRIRSISPRALYTHCKSHILNLTIASSCKLSPIRNMVDSVNALFLFFDASPKRQRFLERMIANQDNASNKQQLLGLCKTRWVERHTCYETLYDLYVVVVSCLDAMVSPCNYDDVYEGETWSWDRETRLKAQGLLHTLRSFEFIIAFLITKNTLESVKCLASTLQKRDADIYYAYCAIDSTIDRNQRFRENAEAEFSEIYLDAAAISEKVDGINPPSTPRVCGRQRHRGNAPAETPEVYYRNNVLIPFMDHLLAQMHDRFSPENRVCSDIFVLVPVVIVTLSDSKLPKICENLLFWRDDMTTPSSLKIELKEWRHMWSTSDHKTKPSNLVECVQYADEDMYPNIRALLVIACTLPIGSATAERSFSCLRRAKTYLRNKTGQERLSDLCLMNIHPDVKIDSNEVLRIFMFRNNRKMLFGNILYD